MVEHVIGFHDVLLTRPMGTTPTRPKGEPVARWRLSVPALFSAIDMVSTGHSPVDRNRAPDLDLLLPALTTDVLVHTWDLARAVAADPQLDPELCVISYQQVRANEEKLRASGMFGPAIPVAGDPDPTTVLVAFLGRDPNWEPPIGGG